MAAKIVIGALALFASPLIALFAITAIASTADSTAEAAAGQAAFAPSDEAIDDIPPIILGLAIREAAQCPGLQWQVLAGILKVESNHGRYRGASIKADGRATPEIIGIPLDGNNGTAKVRDTDRGILDRDPVWDRAVGPAQFIPSTWRALGKDGNADGDKDPHNIYDVVPAMVAHLCPTGTIADIEAAIFNYNRSTEYVRIVLQWATTYTGPLAFAGPAINNYAYPLPTQFATKATATRSHHDYPAIDIPTPVGTPMKAITSGEIIGVTDTNAIYTGGDDGRCGNTVILRGLDGATYTHCHLSTVVVAIGQHVNAGEPLGTTGGQPGAPGAGNTTGPHLHLAIRINGRSVCPQPILLGIINQTLIPPAAAPHTGCVQGHPNTDWATWLANTYRATSSASDNSTATPPNGGVWTLARTQTVTQTASTYMDINFTQPPIGGWSTWANTELTLTYNVLRKPTNAPIEVQLCAWRHSIVKFQEETCSSASRLTITTTGQYTVNLGRPRDWWKKGGRFSWGTSPSIIRVMHKVNKRLPMTSRCGSYCSYGGVSRYVPITGTISVVAVAKSG